MINEELENEFYNEFIKKRILLTEEHLVDYFGKSINTLRRCGIRHWWLAKMVREELKKRVCLHCGKDYKSPSPLADTKFCSRSCAQSYNNHISPKRKPTSKCKVCFTTITTRKQFCSGTCKDSHLIVRKVKHEEMIQNRESKVCPKCKEDKSIEEFYLSTKNSGAVTHSHCKLCNLEQTKTRQRAFKQRAVDYKGGKCEDCEGVFHPACYDFHHLDPSTKDFNLASVRSLKWSDLIQQELDKTVLLCSNCHRVRHVTY